MSLNVNHATGNPVTLTSTNDNITLKLNAGDTFTLLAPQILQVTENGTGATILFTQGSGLKATVAVDESVTDICTAAEQLALLGWTNTYTGAAEDIGINAHNITGVPLESTGSTSWVQVDYYGTGANIINLTTSYANLLVALTATASDETFPNGINTNTINPYSGTTITLTGELIRKFSSLNTAGTTQGTAAPIVSDFTMLKNVGVGATGAILPTATSGMSFVLFNSDAADDANIYPAVSQGIDGLGANSAFVLPPQSLVILMAVDGTVGSEWRTIPVRSDSQLFAPSGSVAAPGLTFKNTRNMGIRDVSATQMGFVVGGAYTALVDASGLVTNVISEQTAGLGTTGKFKPYVTDITTVGANAITIPSGATTFNVKAAGVSEMTIADPTPAQTGVRLTFMASSANAHTLDNSAGSGFNSGGAGSDLATFGGAIGDNLVIEAIGGKWYIVSKVNITLS